MAYCSHLADESLAKMLLDLLSAGTMEADQRSDRDAFPVKHSAIAWGCAYHQTVYM